jgi:hypothetical protein
MENRISGSNQSLDYTPAQPEEAEANMCVGPEPSETAPEEASTDDSADPNGVETLTRGYSGNAQQGHLSAAAQANGGSGGGSNGIEYNTPAPDVRPGGKVYSLEGNVGAGVGTFGVQGAVVIDDECGPGFVGSFNGGAQTPGVSANATAGIAGYEGSFERFNSAVQVAAGLGAGLYGEARVFVDPQTGEPIGSGVAAGVSTPGAGASVTRSESVVFFPFCPRF